MFLAKKSFVCEREGSIGGNSAHQIEVRGRGEMPLLSLSLQINLSRPHSSCEWEFKGSLLNTSISSLNKLRPLEQKTEKDRGCLQIN